MLTIDNKCIDRAGTGFLGDDTGERAVLCASRDGAAASRDDGNRRETRSRARPPSVNLSRRAASVCGVSRLSSVAGKSIGPTGRRTLGTNHPPARFRSSSYVLDETFVSARATPQRFPRTIAAQQRINDRSTVQLAPLASSSAVPNWAHRKYSLQRRRRVISPAESVDLCNFRESSSIARGNPSRNRSPDFCPNAGTRSEATVQRPSSINQRQFWPANRKVRERK